MNKILASRFGLTFISGKSAEIFPFFVCFNKRGLGAVQLFPQPSFPYNFCLWPRTKHARTAASKWSQNLNFFGLFKRIWMNNESTNWPFEKLEKTFPRKTVSFFNSLITGLQHFRTTCFMLWEMLWHSIGLRPIIPSYNFNFFRKSLTQTWLKDDCYVTQLARSQIKCCCATNNTGSKLCQTGQYLSWLWYENFNFWVW